VRLIEASAPLRERASAGISDPYAGDVDHPPTSVHVLSLRGREPGADQFGDELRPKAVRQQHSLAAPISTAGEQFEGAAMVGLRHPQLGTAAPLF